MLFADPGLVEDFTAELADTNAEIARLQARRLFLIHKLDRAGVAQADGARTMVGWTATRLDTTTAAAATLVDTADRLYRVDPDLSEPDSPSTWATRQAVAGWSDPIEDTTHPGDEPPTGRRSPAKRKSNVSEADATPGPPSRPSPYIWPPPPHEAIPARL